MAHFILNSFLLVELFAITESCSTVRESGKEVIKGEYITTVIKDENDSNCFFDCVVYDRKLNVPIQNAVVEINELKIGGFTKDDGSINFNVPIGAYKIMVKNIGNTPVYTNFIECKPKCKIQIRFNLGTVVIR